MKSNNIGVLILTKDEEIHLQRCINSIKNHNKDKKRVKEVIQFVKDKNGLSYAEEKMVEFQKEALQILEKFPQSDYRDSLSLMVNYVIERKK
jgi:octaprenyl-diphosphate synthase